MTAVMARGAVHAVGGERAQVGLDAGAAAGVGAGDGEGDLHARAAGVAAPAGRKRSWKLMNIR